MKNRCIKFDYLYIIFYSIYFIQNPPATYPKLFDGLSYLFYFLYCRNTLKSYALYLFPKILFSIHCAAVLPFYSHGVVMLWTFR